MDRGSGARRRETPRLPPQSGYWTTWTRRAFVDAGRLTYKFPGSELQGSNLITRPIPGGGTDIYINPADFASVYAGRLSPAQVATASVVQRPITAAALGEATTVDPPAATPKWEIVALHDNAIPTKTEFFMAARAHANVVTVNSGHDVPAAAPQVVDSVIVQAAQSAG